VFVLDQDHYLVNTVDFFTPIYHDPYIFGQITAANAVSDIFAMGGKVLNCLNILSFPSVLEPEIVTEILKGAIDKVKEAGGVIAGGHTITTDHIIYGLTVNGIVPKKQLMTNDGARVNQKIILTKKIGTGIYSKEINKNIECDDCLEVVDSMTTLNKKASEIMHQFAVSCVTDVTGFGLLGHLSEVAQASHVTANLYMEQVPLFKRTRELCLEYANGGMKRNASYFGKQIGFIEGTKTQENINILFDPQTSGGLMIFVDESDSEALLEALHREGITQAAIIGETVEQGEKLIKVYGRSS
jgi:selenide, water dikinase